jgi:hypothetical protein
VVKRHSASELDVLAGPELVECLTKSFSRFSSDKCRILYLNFAGATAKSTANCAVFLAVIKILIFEMPDRDRGRNLEHSVGLVATVVAFSKSEFSKIKQFSTRFG